MAKRKATVKKYRKIRAIELFAAGTPFKPRIVASKKVYKRKPRSKKGDE